MNELSVYRGSCHCGAVRFELRTAPLVAALRCNCSHCTRRSAPMSVPYFPPEEIEVQGREALTLYLWGDRMVNHWFCSICGVYPFHDVIGKPGYYRVNLACIEGLDALALPVTWVDGRSF